MATVTTYQLTADTMIERYGVERSLVLARKYAKEGDHFWRYVLVCIEQRAAEAS